MIADLTFVTAKEYLKHNMPIVIKNVWTPLGLDKLKSEFGKVSIKFVWLKCNLKENHRRDRLRRTENQMAQLFKYPKHHQLD